MRLRSPRCRLVIGPTSSGSVMGEKNPTAPNESPDTSAAPWPPVCNNCGQPLLRPGALLITPPDAECNAKKLHLCVPCFELVVAYLDGLRFVELS